MEEEIIKCPVCGKTSKADETFCPNCGLTFRDDYSTGGHGYDEKNRKSNNSSATIIKNISIIYLIVGIIFSFAIGFVTMSENIFIGIVVIILGSLSSFVCFAVLYGIAEIVINTRKTAVNTKVIALSTAKANGHYYYELLDEAEQD